MREGEGVRGVGGEGENGATRALAKVGVGAQASQISGRGKRGGAHTIVRACE